MYNHHLEVRGRIRGHSRPDAIELSLAVDLAFQHIPGASVEGFAEPCPSILALYWTVPDPPRGIAPLPFSMGAGQAFELILGWLGSREEVAYQDRYDGDGSATADGFHLVAKEWGGFDYRALQVSPLWSHHPK